MHMQEHEDSEDKRPECPKCFRQFMSESSLEVHIETAHPSFDYNQMKLDHAKNKEKGLDVPTNRFENDKLFKEDGWRCKKCQKSFNSKEVYEYHMKKHDQFHKCPKCGEEFKTKMGLDVHLANKVCKEQKDSDQVGLRLRVRLD